MNTSAINLNEIRWPVPPLPRKKTKHKKTQPWTHEPYPIPKAARSAPGELAGGSASGHTPQSAPGAPRGRGRRTAVPRYPRGNGATREGSVWISDVSLRKNNARNTPHIFTHYIHSIHHVHIFSLDLLAIRQSYCCNLQNSILFAYVVEKGGTVSFHLSSCLCYCGVSVT